MSAKFVAAPIELRLPATSANLGPGFDALGLAMSFFLTIKAKASATFEIRATGRDHEVCQRVEKNLILETYSDVLDRAGKAVTPLSLTLHNEIPLGMGCGSSAAALLAGVLLANHFGELGWTGYAAMEEACRREGHPDNVATCWLGGMTVSAMQEVNNVSQVFATRCENNCKWPLMIVLPAFGLATRKARALLPPAYGRADVVFNVQNTALLVAAFTLGRGDLLKTAMADRLHQPYRSQACPLLPLLLPLVGISGVIGVALSGAGPSVLLIVEPDGLDDAEAAVHALAPDTELIRTSISKETRMRLLL